MHLFSYTDESINVTLYAVTNDGGEAEELFKAHLTKNYKDDCGEFDGDRVLMSVESFTVIEDRDLL